MLEKTDPNLPARSITRVLGDGHDRPVMSSKVLNPRTTYSRQAKAPKPDQGAFRRGIPVGFGLLDLGDPLRKEPETFVEASMMDFL